MQILNIDAFAAPTRVLTAGGVQYPVEDIDVQAFVDNLSISEELEALQAEGKEVSPRKSVDIAIKTITNAIPTLPLEKVMKLKVPQLMVVLQFIRGELDGQAIASASAEAGEGASEKKPQSSPSTSAT